MVAEVSVCRVSTALLKVQDRVAHHGGRVQKRKTSQLMVGSGNKWGVVGSFKQDAPFQGTPTSSSLVPPACSYLSPSQCQLEWTDEVTTLISQTSEYSCINSSFRKISNIQTVTLSLGIPYNKKWLNLVFEGDIKNEDRDHVGFSSPIGPDGALNF